MRIWAQVQPKVEMKSKQPCPQGRISAMGQLNPAGSLAASLMSTEELQRVLNSQLTSEGPEPHGAVHSYNLTLIITLKPMEFFFPLILN